MLIGFQTGFGDVPIGTALIEARSSSLATEPSKTPCAHRASRISLYCSQSLTIRMYQLPIDMIPRMASVPSATQSP